MTGTGRLDQASRDELMRDARSAWAEAHTFLFVCLGNICRSPFAEHLARAHLDEDRSLMSAGSYPVPGRRAPAEAIAAAHPFGVDLRTHRSQVLSREMLQQADAVYVFDHANRRALVSEQPNCAQRVHWLGALSDDGPLSISDPFGGPASEYELVYRQIAQAIEAVATA
ncbi:MAG: low molecular weight protein arginine phosphatase [Thermoleophilaceae bacterium]|nr:low molecular weight protein arginine phosphatase [Thermoleophilaceae bacterium]